MYTFENKHLIRQICTIQAQQFSSHASVLYSPADDSGIPGVQCCLDGYDELRDDGQDTIAACGTERACSGEVLMVLAYGHVLA